MDNIYFILYVKPTYNHCKTDTFHLQGIEFQIYVEFCQSTLYNLLEYFKYGLALENIKNIPTDEEVR